MVNALGGRPYGYLELPYKESFAQALVESPDFRKWVLRRAIFAEFADESRLLYREMLAKRSRNTQLKANWAFSHYQERTRCACAGCCGQETDLLAVFENAARVRFALHVEVKRPGDGFTGKREKQAAAYPVRARCWLAKPPENVLPHNLASTALLFSSKQLEEFEPHLKHFTTKITFEQIEQDFPNFFRI